MKKITEQSTITISLMIAIAGLAFWLGGVDSQTHANSDKVNKVSQNQEEFQKEVIQRLSRLETMLESKRFGPSK